MPSSLEYVQRACDAYLAGRTKRLILMTGQTVPPSPANSFVSAIAADAASGVARQAVTVTTVRDAVASPPRVEHHISLATFTAVPDTVSPIIRIAGEIRETTDSDSPIFYDEMLPTPVSWSGTRDILVEQGSDGILHAQVLT